MDSETLKSLINDFDPMKLIPDLGNLLGWLELAVRISVMAGPVILLVLGLWYLILPPKEANHFAGYRFYWGMGSVDAWRFTQRMLVPEQMEKLVKHFASSKKMHPIEKAALFHLEFEGIHPFVDGNGRTGRLILNLMLMQAGYPPINVKYSDRKKYYEAFDTYYRNDNAGVMVEIVLAELTARMKQYFGF